METEGDFTYTTADLLRLAERCEAGARILESEADNAAEVTAARKRNAAAAARQYAAALHTEATANPQARIDPDRYAQAEHVATAAEVGGILIDGRRQAERHAQTGSIWNPDARAHWEAGTTPSQIKAAEIEAAGLFSHVADEHTPYWQLGGNLAEHVDDRQAERTDDDGDGDEA